MLKIDNFAADGSRFLVFERFVVQISAWGTPVLTEGFSWFPQFLQAQVRILG
jgi:hypothetical protein